MRSLTLIALLPIERALVVAGFAMPLSRGDVAGDNCKILKEGKLLEIYMQTEANLSWGSLCNWFALI